MKSAPTPSGTDLPQSLSGPLADFRDNLARVDALVSFDSKIINFALEVLNLFNRQHNLSASRSATKNGFDALIRSLENVRANERLRPDYRTIHNQCVVLQVSYFAAVLAELFELNIVRAIRKGIAEKSEKGRIEVALKDLTNPEFDSEGRLGHLILESLGDSFQDMQSICRVFREYFGVVFDYDRRTDSAENRLIHDLIFAQAARHIIVHAGSRVGKRFLRQVEAAPLRRIKPKGFELGHEVQFSPVEIGEIGKSMVGFADALVKQLHQTLDVESRQVVE